MVVYLFITSAMLWCIFQVYEKKRCEGCELRFIINRASKAIKHTKVVVLLKVTITWSQIKSISLHIKNHILWQISYFFL